MWIHNECSFIAETQYETVNNTNCTWICPKCEFSNFSDSFFGEQLNLETENRFVPLTKEKKDRSSPCGTNKSSFVSGLKFISMNINSIRGKKLELLAFLDFHQPHVVAIQETKIDSSIATSELFPETCPYSVYRKDRNIHGGGVMLLVHKDISHMPITELENDSEYPWCAGNVSFPYMGRLISAPVVARWLSFLELQINKTTNISTISTMFFI